MPLLVDVENTIGIEAFVRIAPHIKSIADIVSAYPQFETLTASTSGRMPFPLYDKYIGMIEKSVKEMKAKMEYPYLQNLPMSEGEHVIEVDGMSETVIQHIGSKSLSGRLTLTDHALYFEPSSILSYREAIRFELSADYDHEVLPDLSGPWGSRIFDKAITYQTSSLPEPVVFEFPELTGSTRRDYWLALLLEVIDVQRFIQNYQLEDLCKQEALASAILGILRLRATKGCIQMSPPNIRALLVFNLAEEFLIGGDRILDALADNLKVARTFHGIDGIVAFPNSSAQILCNFGVWNHQDTTLSRFETFLYRFKLGELTPLEKSVGDAREKAKHVQSAKEKEERIKLQGYGANVAVINELLKPVIGFVLCIRDLSSWNRPLETFIFFIFFTYAIYRDWLNFVIPFLLTAGGLFILYLRISKKAKKFREIVIPSPSGGVSLEQVVTVQRAVSQFQGVLQALTVVLLKMSALVLSVKPEATNLLITALFASALVLAILPLRAVAFSIHVGFFSCKFTDKTKESRVERRLREWWHSIPPLSVRMAESEEEKILCDALHD